MAQPVFVLGAPRSGTTLLRVMLAGHPRLFSPPEMVIAPFATMAERRKKLDERFWEKGGLRRTLMELNGIGVDAAKAIEAEWEALTVPEVYQRLIDGLGGSAPDARILVDKCPHLSAEPAALARLARWFPDARWIWIVRHPGSVTRSIENMPMAEVMLQGYAPDARSIWFHANTTIQSFLAGIPADRQVRVTYEDLVQGPERPLRAITDMLGLPYVPAMAEPYEGDRMRDGPPGARAVGDPNMAGRGKLEPELATKWLEGFDPASVSPETHGLARALGYDLSSLPPPPIAAVSDAMRLFFSRVTEIEQSLVVPDDLDALEGRRFLSRMVAQSIDMFVEASDTDRPEFGHAESPTRKMFADNPDADYFRAPIRLGPGDRYRVWGRIAPGTVYVGVLLYGKGGRTAARLADRHFARADGTFELWIAAERPEGVAEGSWLKSDGDETAVFVRQYYTDRATQSPVELHIERHGEIRPDALDAASLARRFQLARRNLDAVFTRTVEARKMAQAMALNRFIPIGGEALFPTPDNSYLVMWYRFGADQRMFIRGQAPEAHYWSFVLYNTWMESLEYRHHRVHRNHAQIQLVEGRYEVCIGHRDFGHPNFIETTGHLAGYVVLRCLLPVGEIPVPQVEVRYDRE